MANQNQTSLFDNYEGTKLSAPTSLVKSFNIKPKPEDDPGLRKLKHNFNHRLKAISKLKEEIEKLPKVFARLNEDYNKIVKPTEERLLAEKLALIESIDKTYAKKSFSETERDFIRYFMIEELHYITEMGYEYDSKFEKYFELDYPFEDEESVDVIQQMLNDMVGLDVDLKDIIGENKLSPEELARKYGDGIKEKAEAFEEEQKYDKRKQEKSKETGGAGLDFDLYFMKTYKDLAKKIHPDLEQDPTLRNEKEKLMQELAHAKDCQDLFQLIAIKLKIERIERNEMVLDEKYLKLYADRLLEQKQALEKDIYIMKKQSGRNSWLYQNFHAMHEKTTRKRLVKYRDDLESELEQCEQITPLIDTVKGMKQHIRVIREMEQENMLYDFW